MRFSKLATLCGFLHALLVLLHLVALAAFFTTLNRHPPTVSPTGHVGVEIASQIFATVGSSRFIPHSRVAHDLSPLQLYCAILVLVTQQLALRRNLQVRQTLSAIHDKSAAWSGLGASVLALVRQRTLNTDVWGVLQVVLYLVAIFALHVTIPSTLLVSPAQVVVNQRHPTQLAYQLISHNVDA